MSKSIRALVVALALALVPGVLSAQTAEYHGTTVFVWDGISAVSVPTPSAGSRALYVDSGTGEISVKTSAGVTVSLEWGVGAAPSADDQVLISSSATAATWKSIPDCDDTGGNHLNYDTTTNAVSCGTSSSGGGGGAPIGAEYWVGQANATLTNETNLGALGTGLIKNTTGVPSIYAGTSGAASQWITALNANGAGTFVQPNFTDLVGSATDAQVPNTITINHAADASAFDNNPADCAVATEFAIGITATGVAVCDAIVDADVPNTITVAATGITGQLAIANGGTGQAGAVAAFDALAPTTTTGDISYYNGTDNVRLAIGTAGQNLTVNAGGTAPSWANPQQRTTLTSTVLQSDAVIAAYTSITGIAFTPAANTNYYMDCFIIYTSSAATTGINFAWDVPAGINSIYMTGTTTTTTTGAVEGFIQRADNVGTATSNAIITTDNVAYLHARLSNGGTAASTTLGFTPETANSVSVLAGSTCQYWVF